MRSKWKRKRRGLVAVGMSLVMAMSVAPPVWATPVTGQAAETTPAQNTVDTTQIGPYYGNTYEGSSSGQQYGSLVTLRNESKFTVTVPKKINFTNLQTVTEKPFANAITATSFNLAPEQTLTVAVENVTLHNVLPSGADGSATKTINAYFATETPATKTHILATAGAGECYVKEPDGDATGTGGSTSNATLYLKPTTAIRAGVWAGKLNYTVTTSVASKEDSSTAAPANVP